MSGFHLVAIVHPAHLRDWRRPGLRGFLAGFSRIGAGDRRCASTEDRYPGALDDPPSGFTHGFQIDSADDKPESVFLLRRESAQIGLKKPLRFGLFHAQLRQSLSQFHQSGVVFLG